MMGTRADFYVGRGEEAEWVGSIGWDGYPDGLADDEGNQPVLEATEEMAFRERVVTFLQARDDSTFAEQGWPWPWDNSQTTDYAYAFDGGKVWASCFGTTWFDPLVEQEDDEDEGRKVPFPNMREQQRVTFGKRSGLMIIPGPPPEDESIGRP